MTNQELMTQAIANMSTEEKAKIFPPMQRNAMLDQTRILVTIN